MGGGNSKQNSQGSTVHGLRSVEYQMLVRCLYDLPFPSGTINSRVIASAAKITERVEYKEPVGVLTKGDRAKGIYILVKGQAKVLLSSSDTVADISPGDFFGELSSLFYVPVTATVQTTTPAQFLLLKAERLRKSVGEVVSTDLMDYYVKQRYFDTSGKLDQSELMQRITIAALKEIPLFSDWSDVAIHSLVQQCKQDSAIPYPVLLVPDKSMLAMEEDKIQEVVIITRGKVEITREKELIATLDTVQWPVWIGEAGLFASIETLCAVRAVTTCQAIKLKKSTIQSISTKYKLEAGKDFEKRGNVWQTRLSQHHQLTNRLKAEVLLPVLINTLSKLDMFSNASLVFFYDVAIQTKAKVYSDKDVIIGGSSNPAKLKKALQGSHSNGSKSQKKNGHQESIARTVAGGEASSTIAENDLFLLVLKGEIAVDGVDSFTFRERELIYLPHTQKAQIKLVAKGETLVLNIEGGRLLNLCNTHPEVEINVPEAIL